MAIMYLLASAFPVMIRSSPGSAPASSSIVGDLDEQPEPVPAVRAGHGGQFLVTPVRLQRVHRERGQAGQLAGAVVPGGHRVQTRSPCTSSPPLAFSEALGILLIFLVTRAVRRVRHRVADVRHLVQVLLGTPSLPGDQRISPCRLLRLAAKPGQVPGRDVGQVKDPPDLHDAEGRTGRDGEGGTWRPLPGIPDQQDAAVLGGAALRMP